MARVALDAHWLGARMTGNETYTLGLLRGLAQLGSSHQYDIFVSNLGVVPSDLASVRKFRWHVLRSNWPPLRVPMVLPLMAKHLGAEILHTNYIAPPYVPCPSVVTVYDVSFAFFPHYFSCRLRWILSTLVPFSVKRAAKVITCSNHTKKDMIKLYSLPASKIDVIYGAVGKDFRDSLEKETIQSVRRKYGLSAPYILAVGNIEPRKNIRRVIEAYALLRGRGQVTHRLAVVGQARLGAPEIRSLVHEKGLEDSVAFTGYVPAVDLPYIYAGADLFIFVSLYEGFGLPVLEAMACGTPVICSNTSSLPEVAGDSALMVNPYDVEQIASAMEHVLRNHELRETLRQKGLVRASCFSWEETARRTEGVWDQVVK